MRIVVSTDCAKIASIAESNGAEVPFLREDSISGDKASSVAVVLDAVDRLDCEGSSVVSMLQPTSPLRDAGDIAKAIELFSKSTADSLLSVCEFKVGQTWLLPMGKDGYLTMPMDLPSKEKILGGRSFYPNGAIYITSVGALKGSGRLVSGNVIPFTMPLWKSIDIDTLQEFRLAELSLTHFASERMNSMLGSGF